MGVRAVIFDFRDTIIDVSKSFKERNKGLDLFLKKKKYNIPRKTFEYNINIAVEKMKFKLKGTGKAYDFEFMLSEFIKLSGVKLSKVEFRTMHDRYIKAYYDNLKIYPDAKPMLEFLKDSNYKTGLVIDGNPKMEQSIIKRFKLAPFFDSIVISEKVGFGKITGMPLEVCIMELGEKASHTIVVGDRIDKDIRPANALGAISVRLVRKGGRYSFADERSKIDKPKYTISKLTELNGLL